MKPISVRKASEIAGISVEMIKKYCRESRYSCWKLGPRYWLIEEKSFRAWLKHPRKTGPKKQKK